MIESEKPVKEEEMETMLSSITSQALEYYNNESKGNEEQKDKGVLVQLPRYNIGSAHFILLTTTPTLHPSYLDPPLMPGTRNSYSLAQIPVCTTLWYEPVHTIPRFSVYLFVPSSGTN